MRVMNPMHGVPRLLAGAVLAALCAPAWAQSGAITNTIAGPDYSSGVSAGPLSDSNFNTPESEGRPGVKFFVYGARALKNHDYRHAIDMFKVSASWAYKPAQYNLGLMHFNGEGVKKNRSLGAAWMVMSAERGNPAYVKTRDQMVTLLTDAQFAETDKLWANLRKTYGNKVALRRAKAQWAWVKSRKTGSRVGGGAGELHVGVFDMGHSPHTKSNPLPVVNGTAILQSGSVDGSLAYRQFRQSENPYRSRFAEKNRKGNATVGPLKPIKTHVSSDTQSTAPAAATSVGKP